jgi:hypothetical protein
MSYKEEMGTRAAQLMSIALDSLGDRTRSSDDETLKTVIDRSMGLMTNLSADDLKVLVAVCAYTSAGLAVVINKISKGVVSAEEVIDGMISPKRGDA